jgi:hypothetical protein
VVKEGAKRPPEDAIGPASIQHPPTHARPNPTQADRMGSDGAANYARRSPWPMINILRTPQVIGWDGDGIAWGVVLLSSCSFGHFPQYAQ